MKYTMGREQFTAMAELKPLPFRSGAIARGEYVCLTIFGRTAFFGIDCPCSKGLPQGRVRVIMALLRFGEKVARLRTSGAGNG